MDIVLTTRGTNRHSFCKQYGYKPNTLQNYWGTNKLPPGNIVADLCEYVKESADYFLYGKKIHLKTASEREATKEMIDLLTEENHLAAIKYLKFLISDQPGTGKSSDSNTRQQK